MASNKGNATGTQFVPHHGITRRDFLIQMGLVGTAWLTAPTLTAFLKSSTQKLVTVKAAAPLLNSKTLADSVKTDKAVMDFLLNKLHANPRAEMIERHSDNRPQFTFENFMTENVIGLVPRPAEGTLILQDYSAPVHQRVFGEIMAGDMPVTLAAVVSKGAEIPKTGTPDHKRYLEQIKVYAIGDSYIHTPVGATHDEGLSGSLASFGLGPVATIGALGSGSLAELNLIQAIIKVNQNAGVSLAGKHFFLFFFDNDFVNSFYENQRFPQYNGKWNLFGSKGKTFTGITSSYFHQIEVIQKVLSQARQLGLLDNTILKYDPNSPLIAKLEFKDGRTKEYPLNYLQLFSGAVNYNELLLLMQQDGDNFNLLTQTLPNLAKQHGVSQITLDPLNPEIKIKGKPLQPRIVRYGGFDLVALTYEAIKQISQVIKQVGAELSIIVMGSTEGLFWDKGYKQAAREVFGSTLPDQFHPWAATNQLLPMLEQLGIKVIDTRARVADLVNTYNLDYSLDHDPHPSPEGYRAIAAAMYSEYSLKYPGLFRPLT